MKKVRFTEEKMVTILREADKSTVAEVARKHKISEQTIYVWKRRFGALQPADVKRLRELETENAKLKRMVAERELSIETLKEINRRKWCCMLRCRAAGYERAPRRRMAQMRVCSRHALQPETDSRQSSPDSVCRSNAALRCGCDWTPPFIELSGCDRATPDLP